MNSPLLALRRHAIGLIPLLLFGCKQDSEQVAVVQTMASALVRKGPSDKRAAEVCALLVAAQQNPMGCDNVVVPLLHYSPAFPGSRVTRRGMSHKSLWSRNAPEVVPLHFEGKKGQGDLDATMQR